MHKLLIYSTLSKSSTYCLLIQFAPVKEFFYKKNYSIAVYNNKKDLFYTIEMLNEIKIFKKYIKYKKLGIQMYLRIKTKHHDIFKKFMRYKFADGFVWLSFSDEDIMMKYYERLKDQIVDYKKLEIEIIH